MRQLKFRVWDIKSKFYFMLDDEDLFMNNYGLYERRSRDYHDDEYFSVPGKYIIEQFTGLLDNKCKEIYENDIADVCITGNSRKRAVCEYDCETGMYFWVNKTDDIYYFMNQVDSIIIGNIHENPELLGESK